MISVNYYIHLKSIETHLKNKRFEFTLKKLKETHFNRRPQIIAQGNNSVMEKPLAKHYSRKR